MGATLLKEVTQATGLPNEPVEQELKRLVTAAGLDESAITLDDLRAVLAEYLQDVMLEVQEEMKNGK